MADLVDEKVTKILNDAESDGAIVAAWEELKIILSESELAWEEQTPPERVGCHKLNRSGEGVGAVQSHHHGHDIIQQGWSWRKASDAVAVQHDGDEELEEFNKTIVNLSDGMFPEIQNMSLLSISASHTNAFLRSVKAESKSACPALADKNGNIDKAFVLMRRPAMEEVVEKGLRWFVLSKHAVKRWPTLIDLVQRAMNTQACESQSEFEVMMSMMQKAGRSAKPDWKSIENEAKYSNPPCKAWIPELSTFVQNYGGAGVLLEDLNLFSRSLGGIKDQAAAGSKKMMGSKFWTKLNGVNFGAGVRRPWLLNAVVKANLACPGAR